MEDEASPIRLDQARRAADEVTYRGDRDRRAGQADMDAVDVICAPKTPPEQPSPVRALRPSIVRERDRDARQEDEGLGAVGAGEIPRRRLFNQISGNMIAEDRDQNDPPPEVDGVYPARGRGLREGRHYLSVNESRFVSTNARGRLNGRLTASLADAPEKGQHIVL